VNVRRPIFAAIVCAALLVVQARADDAKNPLEKAKAGQWVLQKITTKYSGMNTTTLSYTWVDRVEGRKVILKTQTLNPDGKTAMMAAAETPYDLEAKSERAEKKEAAPKPTVTEEEIEVKGKKMKCQKTETTSEIGGAKTTTTTWTSSEIPLYGTAKMVTKDKDGNETSLTETIDWGQDGAKEKPLGGTETPPPGGGDEGMGGGMGGEKKEGE
jgi:hypothetical protein